MGAPRYARAGRIALASRGFRRALPLAAALLAGCGAPVLDAQQQTLVEAARQAGATALHARKLDDGGLLLAGQLDRTDFTLALPWRWNRQSVLFAFGYRPPGLPTTIGDSPLADDANGFLRIPYAQGFAVGRSAYDKAGVAVQSGAGRTLALQRLVQRLGATRSYLMGASMGGDIALALIEKYPDEFAGALALCGAVGGMSAEIQMAGERRALYEYFTRGTRYAPPGDPALARSGLWSSPVPLPKWLALPVLLVQSKRIAAPVAALFEAAAKDPRGPEQRMIERIAALSGAPPDPAAFLMPLALMLLGTDDINAVAGGPLFDNQDEVYASPLLSGAQNAALNAGIQRSRAYPAARARAADWYTPTGRYRARLMTLYNAIDPMAPASLHEPLLRAAVARAGNLDRLVQRSVPAQRDRVGGTELQGYVHCGFTPDEVESAWNALRTWVETGEKPQ